MPKSPKLLIFTLIAFTFGTLIPIAIIGVILQALGTPFSDSIVAILFSVTWLILAAIFIPIWMKAPKLEEVPIAQSWTQSSWVAEANRYYGGRSSSGSGSSRDTEHGAGLGGGYGGGCGCGCGCHH